MSFPTKTTFTLDWSTLPDVLTPGTYTATQLKAMFNERDQELLDFFNSVMAVLISVTAGSSGSENIGSATITGATGATVYDQLVSLQAEINAIVGGAIPPSSVTTAMIQDLAITYAKEDTAGQVARNGGTIYAYKNIPGGL